MKGFGRFLDWHDVTSKDILCGRDKLTFNHTGNRRFRFIIALNQERYRLDKNRRNKGKVVNSIVTQIQKAGGRFLERSSHCEHLWYPVFPSVARQKVSHALRDKCATNQLLNAISELKARLLDHSLFFPQKEDDIFDAISSTILHTTLPQMEHASDQLVTTILAFEVEKYLEKSSTPTSFCSPANLDLLNGQFEIREKVSKFSSRYINKIDKDKAPSKDTTYDESYIQVASFESTNNVMSNEKCMYKHETETMDLVEQSIRGEIYCRSGDHLYNANGKGRSMSLQDSFDLFLDCSSRGSVYTTSSEMWDLPESFTANDCEELVASLDHLSSIFD